jgi:tetratricopeptide (TPR) repeat protein
MMTLTYAGKQNLIYFGIVIFASVCTVVLFHTINQKVIVFNEAESFYNEKDYKQAITLYEKSLKLGMPITKVGPKLAISYVSINELQEAIPVYKLYLEENPKDSHVRLEYAKLLSWLGYVKEAEKEYQSIEDGEEK